MAGLPGPIVNLGSQANFGKPTRTDQRYDARGIISRSRPGAAVSLHATRFPRFLQFVEALENEARPNSATRETFVVVASENRSPWLDATDFGDLDYHRRHCHRRSSTYILVLRRR